MLFSRRHLPHLYAIGHPLFVTFRLHGSLPRGRYFASSLTSGKAFVSMDRMLDRETCGPLYLRMPDIAAIVARALHAGKSDDYFLHAWVIMPNHVHMLITPRTSVSAMLHKLKGVTAYEANRALARTGPFCQHESYDRLVRDEREFRRIENYILQNPVKAGLAITPELYQWSSVWSDEAGSKPAAS